MPYLLDSDSLSDLYDTSSAGHPRIARRLESLDDLDVVFISILALYELEYGYANAPEDRKPAIRQRISALQEDFVVLPLTLEGARVFGELKGLLRSARQLTPRASKSHNVDLMIAATAITEGCTLVSADALYLDLQRLNPELRTENWLAASRE